MRTSILKSIREGLGMSQKSFSALLGLHQSIYCGYENGNIEPRHETAQKIIKALSRRGIYIELQDLYITNHKN